MKKKRNRRLRKKWRKLQIDFAAEVERIRKRYGFSEDQMKPLLADADLEARENLTGYYYRRVDGFHAEAWPGNHGPFATSNLFRDAQRVFRIFETDAWECAYAVTTMMNRRFVCFLEYLVRKAEGRKADYSDDIEWYTILETEKGLKEKHGKR